MRSIVIGRRMALCLFLLLASVIVGIVGSTTKVMQSSKSGADELPIYSVETSLPHVSLGINCAWDNADIPQLLEILDQYSIKATFFIVGDWCDRYPESVRAIHKAGHEIGSHSDTHADMAKLDEQGILREIRDCELKIKHITGHTPDLFRTPSGSYDSNVIRILRQEGYYPIQWDCESIHMKTIK